MFISPFGADWGAQCVKQLPPGNTYMCNDV